jgi:hypothetical protein
MALAACIGRDWRTQATSVSETVHGVWFLDENECLFHHLRECKTYQLEVFALSTPRVLTVIWSSCLHTVERCGGSMEAKRNLHLIIHARWPVLPRFLTVQWSSGSASAVVIERIFLIRRWGGHTVRKWHLMYLDFSVRLSSSLLLSTVFSAAIYLNRETAPLQPLGPQV